MNPLECKLRKLISILNEYLVLDIHKFNYVTQFSDFSILLHDGENPYDSNYPNTLSMDSGMKSVLQELGGMEKIVQRTFSTRKYDIEIGFDGELKGILLQPPQKHRKMINEWIDSGGKKSVQQWEEAANKWTDDPRPTWLADEYRFKPETISVHYCLIKDNNEPVLKFIYHIDEKHIVNIVTNIVTNNIKINLETILVSTQQIDEYLVRNKYIHQGDGYFNVTLEELSVLYNSGKLKSNLIDLKL